MDGYKFLTVGPNKFSGLGSNVEGGDICGFVGETSGGHCVHWHLLGAYYPFSRNHNSEGLRSQDPASLNEQSVTNIRNAIYTCYLLLPYFYTLLFGAYLEGTSVVRSLVHWYSIDSQFILDSFALVNPALNAGQKKVQAHISPGDWVDMITNKTLHGCSDYFNPGFDSRRLPVITCEQLADNISFQKQRSGTACRAF
ncbi:unnamed protein product [Calicophoron daubneyi]|uniref:Glycoside hydrolase family 31 TIM barrel domain-containing protein n=1 Tax=Calicophoron daubneyi TaxID=300641 RepID=A0AAV2TJH2_CALDB